MIEMDARLRSKTPYPKWIVFVCGVLCIAAVGTSVHFLEGQRKERERRVTAENELKTLASEFQLLKEKNRELAEQLREAKKIAEEFAREKEQVRVAARVPPKAEPVVSEPAAEKATAPPPVRSTTLREMAEAFPLKKLALAASKAGNAAAEGWQSLRRAIASSVYVARPEGEAVSGGRSSLSKLMEAFPLPALRQAATDAQRSMGKALGAMRTMFSFKLESPTATAPPPTPPQPDNPKKLTATNEELREELAAVRQEKRELEKKIAERTGGLPGSVDVGRVKITTGRRFSGKVLVVNPKYDFVVVDIGKTQGLEKGVVLIVHRENKFIGKLEVIKVYEKMAAADLITDWMQHEVQVNDGVKKF